MKKLFIIYIILISQFSVAQINELGIIVGGVNPIADVGGDFYFSPNKLAYGLLYKWNAHQKFSVRAQVVKMQLYSDDLDSDISARKKRAFWFKNDVIEASLGLEYHFWDFDMRRRLDKPVTPYIYTGIAYAWYDDLYYNTSTSNNGLKAQVLKKNSASGIFPRKGETFVIPMGLGVKAKVSSQLILAFELSARYSFTNNLDGSYPKDETLKDYRFGNKNSNDWYSMIGVTLTYTFGEYPCYCLW